MIAAPLGPDARRLIGGWRLVSALTDGRVNEERGAHPTGLIFYDPSGWMSVNIQGDHPPVELAGEAPTPAESHAALRTYWAYFGTYTVDEVARTVTHHRTGSVNPGWQRHPDFVRAYEFLDDTRVVLRPQSPARNGNELVWVRLT
jgi:hypothetical protein